MSGTSSVGEAKAAGVVEVHRQALHAAGRHDPQRAEGIRARERLLERARTGARRELVVDRDDADPLRQSGYRHLMRAVSGAGNAAQAVAMMDDCRDALATVSARPSAATENLFRQLVR